MSASRESILEALRAASDGLVFISENDAPFRVVDSPQTDVRALAGRPASDPVEVVSVDHFFRNAVKDQPWHSAAEKATAQRYRALVATLKAQLPDAQAFRVGQISIDVLIVGSAPGGGLVGLATQVVET